ncbi:MAG: 23S rRNA (uracil(1939)-C(5))-methyltransferase RlmD [Lachnospiraceae bacterium]|nr:23S rRNA (uracil(1939)-C(5))-methyltransferase RlmD [Lachnospiraceae bacterium]
MNKNDEFELEITDISNDGEGIGHANGMTFFVKDAVVGDLVLAGVTKLKKSYGYARIIRIIKPSPDRVSPACPIAKRCGGCQLQQMSYASQLEYKQKKVLDAFVRIGGTEKERFVFDNEETALNTYSDNKDTEKKIEFHRIIGMDDPFHYRNKGQFPIGRDKEGNVVCGFYAKHSHEIVDTKSCLLQHDITDALMSAVRKYMDECGIGAYSEQNPSKNGIVRHVLTRVGFTTHEVMICMVIAVDRLPKADRFAAIAGEEVNEYNSLHNADYSLNSVSYNVNKENTNVILGDKVVTIAGLPFITDYVGDIQYRISPLSFYQVNPVQTEELYATALEFASPGENDTVWDLYCGIGTISLYFAKYVKRVYGIEIVPQAIEDAKENAKLNGITNAEFFCGAAEELFPKLMQVADTVKLRMEAYTYTKTAVEGNDHHGKNDAPGETGTDSMDRLTPDIVIVDPPRKGCDAALIDCIGKMTPKKVVYVSCDPATLARDIKLFRDYGYEPVKIRPVDMFPQTGHVETVCLLGRRKPDDTIKVSVNMDDYYQIRDAEEAEKNPS